MTSKTGHVVVQTHWDREWYFSRERYLARLIHAASHFVAELDAGRLDSFLFDGQTIAAEDLLDACEPALAARVRALMAEGRIVVGPWYVSADEFLVAGECLIRNLERGMARAAAFGHCQKVGYVPDTFGHIAQLPQILRGFGIDNAVLWRGSDHPASEAEWHAPDGSAVLAVLLTQGYYQHLFNVADWQGAVTAYFRAVAPAATTGHLLLTQGGDHLVTAGDMIGRVGAYNAAQDEFRLQLTDLESYIATVRSEVGELPVITGDLRQNHRAFVLPDILSTRRYLKQANQRVEDRLIGLVEPLLAATAWADTPYPRRYLERTWDLLLQQQPHDSICGCSVDAVHDEMMTRFAMIDDRLDALVEMAAQASGMTNDRAGLADRPTPFADYARCTLFNSSLKRFSGWVEAELFLAGAAGGGLSATRADGKPIDVAVIAVAPHRAFTSPLDDFPEHVAGHRYRVAFRTELNGLDMAAVELAQASASEPGTAGDTIGNAHYEVRVDGPNDALVLTDRASGRRFSGLFAIESTLDAGDSYNYSPPRNPATSHARITHWQASGIGTACETLTIDLVLDQPAGLAGDRAGPAGTVRSEGRLVLRLLAGESLLRAALTWHNRACDHRLRLVLPLPEAVAATASDGGFAWTTRPVVLAEVPDAPSRTEARVSVNPSHSAIAAGPFGFIHRGLQEFEVERCGDGDRLGVTLLRSVGWLSRRDLRTRGVGAGPDMETPGAQCLGEQRYDFALTLDAGRDAPLNRAAAWRRPPALLRGHASVVPHDLTLTDDRLQVSSLRRIDDAIELRLWNTSADAVPVDLPGWDAEAVDLARRPRADWTGHVAPYGIATLLLRRARP